MKKLLLLITILLTLSAKGQNLPTIDYRPIHFGFNLGVNILDYGIKQSNIEQNGTLYQSDISTLIPGFTVGVFTHFRLNRYFGVRVNPSLYLGSRTISFANSADDDIFKTTLQSTMMTVPILVKYSSVRLYNYRPYVLLGGGVLFEFDNDKTKPLLQNGFDYFIEFGVGCTYYSEYFRLSPELRFAVGFNNMLIDWDTRAAQSTTYLEPSYEKYTRSITRLTSRIITLAFNFE